MTEREGSAQENFTALMGSIDDLRDQFREHRQETRSEFATVKDDIKHLNDVAAKGRGALQVVLWLGAIAGVILSTFSGFWGHIFPPTH